MGQINQDKEEFWRQQVAAVKKYDGSVGEFCREQGLSPSTFSYWRHKFNKASRGSALVPSAFVPVKIERERPTMRGLPDPKWLAEFVSHLCGAHQ